jgi:hypothetical protein
MRWGGPLVRRGLVPEVPKRWGCDRPPRQAFPRHAPAACSRASSRRRGGGLQHSLGPGGVTGPGMAASPSRTGFSPPEAPPTPPGLPLCRRFLEIGAHDFGVDVDLGRSRPGPDPRPGAHVAALGSFRRDRRMRAAATSVRDAAPFFAPALRLQLRCEGPRWTGDQAHDRGQKASRAGSAADSERRARLPRGRSAGGTSLGGACARRHSRGTRGSSWPTSPAPPAVAEAVCGRYGPAVVLTRARADPKTAEARTLRTQASGRDKEGFPAVPSREGWGLQHPSPRLACPGLPSEILSPRPLPTSVSSVRPTPK